MFNKKNDQGLLKNKDFRGISPIIHRLNEFDFLIKEYSDNSVNNKNYLIFKESEDIINLLSVLNRDGDNFSIMISNKDNEMNYGVSFDNKNNEMNEYFEKIIYGFLSDEIILKSREMEILNRINNRMKKMLNSDLSYSVNLNSDFFEYMNKTGKTNMINIYDKKGYDMYQFAKKFSKISNLQMIYSDNDYINSLNFIESSIDKKNVIISLSNEYVNKIVNVIDFSDELIKDIPKIEGMNIEELDYGG